MKVDLHLHSNVSDGHLPPDELVRAAHAGGLDVIALTDHDTVGGVGDALAAAAALPLRVIPGIEMSTRWEAHELHILGYWVDPESAPILEHQATAAARRVRRMEGMVGKLRAMGIPITYDAVATAAGPTARSIGRPHLARALLAGGHTRYYGEAFERYIADGGPAFVAERFPTPAEAVERIHAAGGVAVWAHPDLQLFTEEFGRAVEWGLDGVECFRVFMAPEDVRYLEQRTREAGLFPTGGSDWHGPMRMSLGEFYVHGDQVPELLAAGDDSFRAGG